MSKMGNIGFEIYGGGSGGSQETLATDEIVVLEQLFLECATLNDSQRLDTIFKNQVLSHLDSEQMTVWFANHRCELQRNEAHGFQSLNDKLAETRRLLLLENYCLQREVQRLVSQNEYIRNLLENVSAATSETNSIPAVSSDQYSYLVADNSKGLLLLTKEIMREIYEDATEGAFEFLEEMKEIVLLICSDLFCFPVNEMLFDDSFLQPFAKTEMPPAGSSPDHLLLCCSFKVDQLSSEVYQDAMTALVPAFPPQDIKLDETSCEDDQESQTTVVHALPPQGFGVRPSGGGMENHVPYELAVPWEVFFSLGFEFINWLFM